MRLSVFALVIALIGSTCAAAPETAIMHDRRQRAAGEFHDGILLIHANSRVSLTADGFRQDPFFYYFTGLANTVGGVLAIDGKAAQSWLFLPSNPPFSKSGLRAEVRPGAESEKLLGIEHVVDWSRLEEFLASHADQRLPIYYADDFSAYPELPQNLLNAKSPGSPAWLQVLLQRWPGFDAKEAGQQVEALMEVQSSDELAALRLAAKTTVAAIMAGMRAIRPGISQRSVEAVVEKTCWSMGAHGSSFWPWAMAGDDAVFPHPFWSLARYDHLNRDMRSGELVRLDVGCEGEHYMGDLGRTVPVSGHYDAGQRETWEIFVAAYHAGARVLRDGVTVDQIFEVWKSELVSHRVSAKTNLAQHAIASWSDRKNVPYWQIHTTNLLAGRPMGAIKAGTTINFEPIASIDGQGFFLEDMYLVTKDGAELLTPGVPYSASEIEAAMHCPTDGRSVRSRRRN